ncbi:hypothetical protein pb186bvf_009856 [Paramecium bursaria]
MQDYCENCSQIYQYQDEIKVLSQRLELTQAQVKVLKNENEILRKSISKNHKRTNNQPNKASKTLELEIEKLKEIIRQKDEIIKEQVPFDNFSETSSVTQQNLLFLKIASTFLVYIYAQLNKSIYIPRQTIILIFLYR